MPHYVIKCAVSFIFDAITIEDSWVIVSKPAHVVYDKNLLIFIIIKLENWAINHLRYFKFHRDR